VVRGRIFIAVGLVVGLVLLPACGGGGPKGTATCDGTPLDADAMDLPADFPIPDKVTIDATDKQGASHTFDGWFDGSLEDAYHAWKDAFESAGYTVLFDELEERDSEVSYASADNTSTGQVAMKSDCVEAGRTDVHITNRPA